MRKPTNDPKEKPTKEPTEGLELTENPTNGPTKEPTIEPTKEPTEGLELTEAYEWCNKKANKRTYRRS